MKKNTIRIIGGICRRSNITIPDVEGLRPTPDRVRETLFNWLHHLWQGRFHDKSVFDVFAGSGALGFEAASRGVEHVQMVDNNPTALQHLRATRDRLQLSQVRIHSHDAFLVLSRMDASRFDAVFLDPPFHHQLIEKVIPYLDGILKPEGLVYTESEYPITLPAPFQSIRQGKAGMVYYQLFRKT